MNVTRKSYFIDVGIDKLLFGRNRSFLVVTVDNGFVNAPLTQNQDTNVYLLQSKIVQIFDKNAKLSNYGILNKEFSCNAYLGYANS